MNTAKDLLNKRFGKLTVIERLESDKNGKSRWFCKCDCGNYSITKTYYLNSGQTKSCGCIKRSTLGSRTKTHGMSNTETYNIWTLMKRRCLDKKSRFYHNYGGRGIEICDRWLSFENFLEDMGERPKNLTLDRINNNGNYCKENCRWATRKQQMNNVRKNVIIKFNGKTRTLPEWSEATGINVKTLRGRLFDYGWSIEKALTIDPKLYKNRGVK